MELHLLADIFAVTRLPSEAEVPGWAEGGRLVAITRTPDELSILCREASLPADVQAQRGFRCLRVQGPLAFTEVGVLASLAGPLAAAAISIFVVSTYDTDYLLLPADHLERGVSALEAAGHSVLRSGVD